MAAIISFPPDRCDPPISPPQSHSLYYSRRIHAIVTFVCDTGSWFGEGGRARTALCLPERHWTAASIHTGCVAGKYCWSCGYWKESNALIITSDFDVLTL